MNSVHETFHGSVAQPPGSYARHDIEVTEPAADVPRPAADYARHDVQVTASTGPARLPDPRCVGRPSGIGK